MKQFAKYLLIFCPLLIIGCSSGINATDSPNIKYFLNSYVSYVESIQKSKFPENIGDYFSKKTISKFKKEYDLLEIKADDVGWIIHSTYMPQSSLKDHYLKYTADGSACFTIIGKSHEGYSMYVNFKFTKVDIDDWKIDEFNGHAFDESVIPVFPSSATCPKNPES